MINKKQITKWLEREECTSIDILIFLLEEGVFNEKEVDMK